MLAESSFHGQKARLEKVRLALQEAKEKGRVVSRVSAPASAASQEKGFLSPTVHSSLSLFSRPNLFNKIKKNVLTAFYMLSPALCWEPQGTDETDEVDFP